MPTAEMEAIKKELNDINRFVRDRIDPVTKEVDLLREESERLKEEVLRIRQRDRALRRDAVMRHAEEHSSIVVPEGPYAGMDILDLALLRRFAHSQRRESFGPAWAERAEGAKRTLAAGLTPAVIQASHQASARKLEEWYSVDRKPTGQFEGFGRSVLQALTRAAMDSTTAGSGDELVATLEARELWMDVNLHTLVAPLVPTFPMPSNPFDIPRQLGEVNFYPGTENTAAAATALSTGKATLTAYELVGQVPYSFTLEEDSVVALLPEIRAGLVRNVAEVLDDIILNADTTATKQHQRRRRQDHHRRRREAHWLRGTTASSTCRCGQHGAAQQSRRGGLGRHVQRDQDQARKVRREALAARLGDGRKHLHPHPVRQPVPHYGQAGAGTPPCSPVCSARSRVSPSSSPSR